MFLLEWEKMHSELQFYTVEASSHQQTQGYEVMLLKGWGRANVQVKVYLYSSMMKRNMSCFSSCHFLPGGGKWVILAINILYTEIHSSIHYGTFTMYITGSYMINLFCNHHMQNKPIIFSNQRLLSASSLSSWQSAAGLSKTQSIEKQRKLWKLQHINGNTKGVAWSSPNS